MIIIYGGIQPDGLVLSVHKITINTTALNAKRNKSAVSTTTTTIPVPTPPRIRGKFIPLNKWASHERTSLLPTTLSPAQFERNNTVIPYWWMNTFLNNSNVDESQLTPATDKSTDSYPEPDITDTSEQFYPAETNDTFNEFNKNTSTTFKTHPNLSLFDSTVAQNISNLLNNTITKQNDLKVTKNKTEINLETAILGNESETTRAYEEIKLTEPPPTTTTTTTATPVATSTTMKTKATTQTTTTAATTKNVRQTTNYKHPIENNLPSTETVFEEKQTAVLREEIKLTEPTTVAVTEHKTEQPVEQAKVHPIKQFKKENSSLQMSNDDDGRSVPSKDIDVLHNELIAMLDKLARKYNNNETNNNTLQ